MCFLPEGVFWLECSTIRLAFPTYKRKQIMRSKKFYIAFSCTSSCLLKELVVRKGKWSCKRGTVRPLKLSVGSSLLNWCGFKIKS